MRVLRNDYSSQTCSIARALELVGERWTILILRDVFLGVRRFDELQADLGVARNVLSSRLDKLVDAEILERHQYSERPPRDEYRLTERGLDLWPTIVALMQWGDEHVPAPGGPPTVLRHKGCGGGVDPHRRCDRCGADLGPRDVEGAAGPGATAKHPLLRVG